VRVFLGVYVESPPFLRLALCSFMTGDCENQKVHSSVPGLSSVAPTCSVSSPLGQSFRKPLCLQQNKRQISLCSRAVTGRLVITHKPVDAEEAAATYVACLKLSVSGRAWLKRDGTSLREEGAVKGKQASGVGT
jgi:hypothetical protein